MEKTKMRNAGVKSPTLSRASTTPQTPPSLRKSKASYTRLKNHSEASSDELYMDQQKLLEGFEEMIFRIKQQHSQEIEELTNRYAKEQEEILVIAMDLKNEKDALQAKMNERESEFNELLAITMELKDEKEEIIKINNVLNMRLNSENQLRMQLEMEKEEQHSIALQCIEKIKHLKSKLVKQKRYYTSKIVSLKNTKSSVEDWSLIENINPNIANCEACEAISVDETKSFPKNSVLESDDRDDLELKRKISQLTEVLEKGDSLESSYSIIEEEERLNEEHRKRMEERRKKQQEETLKSIEREIMRLEEREKQQKQKDLQNFVGEELKRLNEEDQLNHRTQMKEEEKIRETLTLQEIGNKMKPSSEEKLLVGPLLSTILFPLPEETLPLPVESPSKETSDTDKNYNKNEKEESQMDEGSFLLKGLTPNLQDILGSDEKHPILKGGGRRVNFPVIPPLNLPKNEVGIISNNSEGECLDGPPSPPPPPPVLDHEKAPPPPPPIPTGDLVIKAKIVPPRPAFGRFNTMGNIKKGGTVSRNDLLAELRGVNVNSERRMSAIISNEEIKQIELSTPRDPMSFMFQQIKRIQPDSEKRLAAVQNSLTQRSEKLRENRFVIDRELTAQRGKLKSTSNIEMLEAKRQEATTALLNLYCSDPIYEEDDEYELYSEGDEMIEEEEEEEDSLFGMVSTMIGKNSNPTPAPNTSKLEDDDDGDLTSLMSSLLSKNKM